MPQMNPIEYQEVIPQDRKSLITKVINFRYYLVNRKIYLKFMYIRKLSNMKTHLCEIVNKWNWSIETAGIWVASPSGNAIRIRKLDCDLISDAVWTHLEPIVQLPDGKRELTVEQMFALSEAVKAGAGELIRARKQERVDVAAPKTPKKLEAQASGTGVAAPQTGSKAQPQKSYAQRKFERSKRIQANKQKILGGCCPSCNSGKLKVKRHAGWIGYYCGACKGGGSLTLKK